MSCAWHYTVGPKLSMILEDGRLRPTAQYIAPGERPILWFSRNPVWERSASKAVWNPTLERTEALSFEVHQALLLVRFGIAEHRLAPWPKLGRQAGTPPEMVTGLERSARGMGADPRQWLGTQRWLGRSEQGR